MSRTRSQSRHRSLMAAAFTFLALSLPVQQVGAQTANGQVDATDPAAIMELIRGYGTANLVSDNRGDPKITGRINGVAYAVYFYSCTNNKNCKRIQFRASWENNGKAKISDMNDWNRTKVFGKAYLDSENDPVIEMPIVLNYGVSKSNLDNIIGLWATVAKEFKEKLASL